jgi:hypothetical protein
MKTKCIFFYGIITGLLSFTAASGQTDISDFDTVAWVRVGVFSDKYRFAYPTEMEIKLQEKPADLVKYKASPVFGNIGNTALTVLTGIGFVSSSEVNWKLSAVIKCNDALPDWKIDLFCEGELEKDRERVRNDDGSWSVETVKTATYFWERNSTGIIMEGSDTIGFFKIVLNPEQDSTLAPYAKYFFLPSKEQTETNSSRITRIIEQYSLSRDYGITGVFRGRSFAMISDGSEYLAWGLMDGHYSFKHLFDDGDSFTKSKARANPRVLISRDTDMYGRSDFFRLAMTNLFLTRTFK